MTLSSRLLCNGGSSLSRRHVSVHVLNSVLQMTMMSFEQCLLTVHKLHSSAAGQVLADALSRAGQGRRAQNRECTAEIGTLGNYADTLLSHLLHAVTVIKSGAMR